ncbi:hypothetical protein ACFXG4_08405 [Nocardia sp. NPDC059246]|uniref:hypothetical protein n=1 Tax=unclassified Nocardia TaxID=2637762 RepID=UPI003677A055
MQDAWTGADATALRKALGIPQKEFARLLGIGESTVKKYAARKDTIVLPDLYADIMETALARATPDQRARYLASKQARVEIVLPDSDDDLRDSDVQQWEPGVWTADCAAIAHDLTRKDLIVDRRQATRALLGVIVGANLLEPLERWLSSPAAKAETAGRATGVGVQEVEQLETAARVFRDWDDQYGGGLRRKAVIGQLDEVTGLLDEQHPPQLRARLTVVLAQLAETAATMSWDCGQQAVAQRYYVLAVRAAKAAGDSAFAANALAGMARQLLCLGRASDALELVRLAQDVAGPGAAPAVRAMLDTREAWAYANLARPTAFQRTSDRGYETLAAVVVGESPHWIGYFDSAEFAGTTGGRLLEMAQRSPEFAAPAAEHIGQAIALRTPNRLRSSALDQLGIAEARLIQGEVEQACQLGTAALSTVERTASDRVRVKVGEIFARTSQLADVTAVAELRDRMQPFLAAPV